MLDIHNSKLPVRHFTTRLYGYNILYRLSVHVTHYDRGAVNVKVSVFNADLKYKVKESQNNAAPFENSGIQRFPAPPSPFIQKGKPSRKIQGMKLPINIRNRSANGAFSIATTDKSAKARSVKQSYRKRMRLQRKK